MNYVGKIIYNTMICKKEFETSYVIWMKVDEVVLAQ